jgi:purine-nucleoside/S-methyl-5'-thioadenosine phosphorylase / adenosine deaminase
MLRHEYVQPDENLVYYTFPLFEAYSDLACVVSTRLGGVSTGDLRSLNLSFRTGDTEEAVMENRARLYRILDISAVRVAQAQLVHGNHIEAVTNHSPLDAFYKFPATDGLVTALRDRPLFIPVADCAAIAFFDPKRQTIGMIHTGWKGVANRIPQRMIEMMQTVYGCNPANILVGVSPGIGPCCYQVREDLVTIFTQAFPQEASRFFLPQPDKTLHLDMWAALRWQLLAVNILPEHLEIAEICTACHTDEFYSHRAEHGKTGRFASLIVLRA